MAKMFEDAFRSIGLLEEDTPAYVARSILDSIAVPPEKRAKGSNAQRKKTDAKNEDYLEVTITPYGKSQ